MKHCSIFADHEISLQYIEVNSTYLRNGEFFTGLDQFQFSFRNLSELIGTDSKPANYPEAFCTIYKETIQRLKKDEKNSDGWTPNDRALSLSLAACSTGTLHIKRSAERTGRRHLLQLRWRGNFTLGELHSGYEERGRPQPRARGRSTRQGPSLKQPLKTALANQREVSGLSAGAYNRPRFPPTPHRALARWPRRSSPNTPPPPPPPPLGSFSPRSGEPATAKGKKKNKQNQKKPPKPSSFSPLKQPPRRSARECSFPLSVCFRRGAR